MLLRMLTFTSFDVYVHAWISTYVIHYTVCDHDKVVYTYVYFVTFPYTYCMCSLNLVFTPSNYLMNVRICTCYDMHMIATYNVHNIIYVSWKHNVDNTST